MFQLSMNNRVAAGSSRTMTVISAGLCQGKAAPKEITNMSLHFVVVGAHVSCSSVLWHFIVIEP